MLLTAMLTRHWLHKNVAILLALAGFFVTFSANVSAQELTTLQNATTDQINVAKNYWVYAAISNNVYNDHIPISLLSWTRQQAEDGLNDFHAETFVKKEKGKKISEIVIAYRGTDSLQDWVQGNLFNSQQLDANKYADKIIAQYVGVPIKLTGHSLGGALAQNVANRLQLQAIVFDTSPMNGFNYGTSAKSIVSIHEYAEAITLLRIFQRSDMAVYNFIDSIDPLTNHDMYPLANGMKALALASSHINSNSNTQSNGTSNTPASTPPATTQTSTTGVDCVGSNGNKTTGLSGAEAAKALGATKEWDRQFAIQQMASNNSICSPLSANGAKLILQGTTSGAREGSVVAVAKLIKQNLTGEEVSTILGGIAELAEWNRQAAIIALVKAERLGVIGTDAALFLKGTSSGAREGAIVNIAKSLKPNLTGEEVSTILGGIAELAEWNRQAAIIALVKAERLGVVGTDAALFLKGTSSGAREGSIVNIAKSLKPNLTGEEVATILGGVTELAEWNRQAAIIAIANGGKLKGSYSGDEMAAMLQGTTGGARAGSIVAITKAR